jgi:signal transduction histidine kinase
MRLSLRFRLLLPLTLLLAGDAAATAWAASTAAAAAERRLANQQWAIARTLTVPPTFPLTQPVLNSMKGFTAAEFLLVHPNRPPISTLPEPLPATPLDVPIATPTEGEEHRLGPPVTVAGSEYRCLRMPLRGTHPDRGGDLYIFYPESLRRTAVRDAVRPTLVLGLVGGLIALGLALVIGTRLVRRIRELDQRTRLIAGGDFQPMPLPTPDDELTDLCKSVNDMARRLAEFQAALERDERLRVLGQFSGGLAHQLRNAASGAKLALELYLAENPHADPEPLHVALRQLARIEGNLRQFLDLGKPPANPMVPCDLGALIDQAVNLLRPQCQHVGTALTWEAPDSPAAIVGDPASLSHLFGNVIGNAVEAAGPGGSASVSLAATSQEIVVEVLDTGPGPPLAIAEKLFESFVTGKPGGIGLGLAVAKQAIEAHGGTLRWERREGKTAFILAFETVARENSKR